MEKHFVLTELRSVPPKASESVHKVWTRGDILINFLGLLELICRDDAAFWFQNPVDAIALKVPHYYDVIRNPMDLSTIRQKMEDNLYKDPWEIINDFNLIFNNSRIFNDKSSEVNKCNAKVCISRIFPLLIVLN